MVDARNKRYFCIVLGVGLFVLGFKLLVIHDLERTSLLYVGYPFFIALFLTQARSFDENRTWKQRWLSVFTDGLIILLASSVLLFEGFLCVMFFLPIYVVLFALAFFIYSGIRALGEKSGRNYSIGLGLLTFVLLSSQVLEGVNEDLSYERTNTIQIPFSSSLGSAEIFSNLNKPIDMTDSRSGGILDIFPYPYKIDTDGLYQGAKHTIYYRYQRWFFTNTKEGSVELHIDRVSDNQVVTSFSNDTSYLATYMELKGTRIIIDSESKHQTSGKLEISYERKLDPYWYFDPLQRYFVRQMGKLLIEEILLKSEELG